MYPVKVEPKLYFLVVHCSLKVKKKKKKNYYFAFTLLLSLSSLPLRVSPNVHHVFTLLLAMVVFWWLNEILFYCNIYIILVC